LHHRYPISIVVIFPIAIFGCCSLIPIALMATGMGLGVSGGSHIKFVVEFLTY